MRRSTGITVTAVLAFVGGGFTVLVALGTALMSVLMSNSRASYALPRSFLLLAVVYYSGAAFWAIATGVGLLRLRDPESLNLFSPRCSCWAPSEPYR